MGGWFRMLAVAAGVVATAGAASAQTGFPAKAVHLFVPYPAGGAVDILARTLGDELSKQWGQPVIIENRPGRGRPGRIAGARHLAAGRLHADRGRQRPRHQSVPLSENPLRHLQGFHADLLAGVVTQHSAGARGLSVQDAGRSFGAGARQARRPVLRHGRQWHLDASRRRVVEESRSGRHCRDPLQGRRACDERSAGRPDSDVVQQRTGVGRTDQRRHGSRARRHHREARAVPARCSHHGRGGRGRLRHRRVVGPGRAGRDAGRISWRNCRAISSPP